MASKLLHLHGPLCSSLEFQHLHLDSRQNSPAKILQSSNRSRVVLSPPLRISTRRDNRKRVRAFTVRSQFNAPLIAPHDQWGNWTALFAIVAFGIWSEKTKIGSALSGPLVSTLVGLASSNLGIISSNPPAFKVVLEFLLPVAVPLLLYRADLHRVIKSTGALLLTFLLGSAWSLHSGNLQCVRSACQQANDLLGIKGVQNLPIALPFLLLHMISN